MSELVYISIGCSATVLTRYARRQMRALVHRAIRQYGFESWQVRYSVRRRADLAGTPVEVKATVSIEEKTA